MSDFDLVIRGGTVADGLGAPPFEADVAISGGRITAVGAIAGRGREEIDAARLLVTPGFIDLHTHYDAQATWDPILAPSAWHGVTTLVTGNCGVGFAPARPEARSWLIEVMENVEEIPSHVLDAGLAWDWESFPDYLDALDARRHTLDIAAQVPHIALRGYVMGDRAKTDEPATEDDIAQMVRLLEQGLRAGAIGFGCSRTDAHRYSDGRLIPGSFADREELLALADGVRRAGHGQIQYLGLLSDWEGNLPFMTEMARRAGTAVHFTMIDRDWQSRIAGIEAAAAEGVRIVGHLAPRAIGNIVNWRTSRHPFMDRASIKAIVHLPWPKQLARLKDPAFRAQVLSEPNEGEERLAEYARVIYRAFDSMYEVDAFPDYEPDPTTHSIAALAARAGVDPFAYAYDVMMRDEGEGMIYLALANYASGNLHEIRELIRHPGIIAGLSDTGAHCLRVVDGSSTTFMLAHWARDRSRGETLPLETMVRCCTSEPARAYGLEDRGVVAPGYLADLNVIDFAKLRLPAPYLAADLPDGGSRLLQKADGYVATIKRGQVTFREGVHLGVFPGHTVRGPQPAPGAAAIAAPAARHLL